MTGPPRLRRAWQRTSLRARLILLLVTLVAVALAVTGTAGSRLLRNELTGRIDRGLTDAGRRLPASAANALPPYCRPGQVATGAERFFPNDRVFVVLDASGKVVGRNCTTATAGADPSLPALAGTTPAQARARGPAPYTAGSDVGSGRWRVSLRTVTDSSGHQFTVASATSLTAVDAVVGRLEGLQVMMALAVIALLAAVGAVLVRWSLRPLSDIEDTAEAIAGGDLSRRVPEASPRTEVGHLAGALNGMLAQIETAVVERETSEGAARASEQRMRRFIADASHELRTPLTSIQGFAELFRTHATSTRGDDSRLVERIESEARRMGGLVEDLLMLARLDQGRPLRADRVDLVPLVTDAAFDLHTLSPDRRVGLTLPEVEPSGAEDPEDGPDAADGADDDGPPPVFVVGEEAGLRQVLANLASNAAIHTPAGTAIQLSLQVDDASGWAVVDVRDEGPGFTPDEAAHAFDRFYRADPARTRARGGTGLGLSIVASIVRAHGGSVELCREADGGTDFRVRLPLAASAGGGSTPS